MVKHRVTGPAMFAGLAVLLASCGHPHGFGTAVVYSDHRGAAPLSLKSGAGILSVQNTTGAASWSATWGGLLPCVKGGGTATIVEVTPVTAHRPISVRVVLRDVSRPKGVSAKNWRYQPLMASQGEPPSFGDGRSGRMAGGFRALPARLKVSSRCSANLGRNFQELFIVARLTGKGADFLRTDVRFVYRHRSYVLRVPIRMIACGSAVTKKYCQGE